MGELGDGTNELHKDEAVKIADDVIDAGSYCFLKSNGELWAWDYKNPTPIKVLDDVACIRNGIIHFNDGKCIFKFGLWYQANEGTRNQFIIDNVKIPQMVEFK